MTPVKIEHCDEQDLDSWGPWPKAVLKKRASGQKEEPRQKVKREVKRDRHPESKMNDPD